MATVNIKKLEVEIPEISKLEMIRLPEMSIHGVPWAVETKKKGQGEEQCLAVYLYCGKKDNSPDWSIWGKVSLKLLPVDVTANAIEFHTDPFVFDKCGIGYGAPSLIKWKDLFSQDEKFVKNDTINLKVEIDADNPNDPNRSRLSSKYLHKCCDKSNYAMFQLTVTNVSNLMAVKSTEFTLCGLPWYIELSKTRSGHLGAMLRLNKDSGSVLCKLSIKAVSSKKNIRSAEKCITKQYKYLTDLRAIEVLSWQELIKSENGFVNNDSITLEIEINAGQPNANDEPIVKRAKINSDNDTKSPQMECPICFKCIAGQNLAVTPCGHIFCLDCIEKAINSRAVCPTCNKAAQKDALRRIYLPVIN